jgi:hypothetical protein
LSDVVQQSLEHEEQLKGDNFSWSLLSIIFEQHSTLNDKYWTFHDSSCIITKFW